MMIRKDLKPETCCECGSYAHTIDMSCGGRSISVDYCIHDIVAALNAAGITTIASCCGHGVMGSHVMLEDGREIVIFDSCDEANADEVVSMVEDQRRHILHLNGRIREAESDAAEDELVRICTDVEITAYTCRSCDTPRRMSLRAWIANTQVSVHLAGDYSDRAEITRKALAQIESQLAESEGE